MSGTKPGRLSLDSCRTTSRKVSIVSLPGATGQPEAARGDAPLQAAPVGSVQARGGGDLFVGASRRRDRSITSWSP